MEEPTTKEQSTNKTRTVTREDVRKMREAPTQPNSDSNSNTSNSNDGRGDGGGYKK
jgi:hypothetical protein